MAFSQTFQALLKEAQFTREILGSGATQIRRANYARKGIYFQAFTSLSTGLERIGKLCLMLDYYITSGGHFPDFKYLKNEIGHNIPLLFSKAQEVTRTRSMSFQFNTDLSDSIHQSIITILGDFAAGDRYSNINLLVNSKQTGDPVAMWFERVDMPLYEQRVSVRKKEKITANAHLIAHTFGALSMVRHISETGSDISTVEEGSLRTGMQNSVAPYRQLYVLHVVRYWAQLLMELQYAAMSVNNNQEIPFFSEIFALFYNSDEYFRSRKTWENV